MTERSWSGKSTTTLFVSVGAARELFALLNTAGGYLCLDTQRSFRLMQQVRVTGLSHPGSLHAATPVERTHVDDEQVTEPASYTELSLKSIGPAEGAKTISFCVCGLSAPPITCSFTERASHTGSLSCLMLQHRRLSSYSFTH